jgi:opacity protein-like surface antigen
MRSVATAILFCLTQAAPLAFASAQEPRLPADGVAAPPAQSPPSAAPAPQPPPYAAHAAPNAMPVSLALRVGMYSPQDDSSDSLMSVMNDGIDFEGAVVLQVHPNVALEGAVGYYRSSSDKITEWDPTYGTVTAKLGLSVIPITASVRFLGQVDRLTVFGLAGVGLHMASLKAEIDVPGFISGSATEDDNAFGFHVGAGAAIQVSPAASVGVELRRTFVDASFAGEDVDLGGLRIAAMLSFRL